MQQVLLVVARLLRQSAGVGPQRDRIAAAVGNRSEDIGHLAPRIGEIGDRLGALRCCGSPRSSCRCSAAPFRSGTRRILVACSSCARNQSLPSLPDAFLIAGNVLQPLPARPAWLLLCDLGKRPVGRLVDHLEEHQARFVNQSSLCVRIIVRKELPEIVLLSRPGGGPKRHGLLGRILRETVAACGWTAPPGDWREHEIECRAVHWLTR